MKKLTLLTLGLLVSACGGGSGGGGALAPGAVTTPVTFTDRVATNNSVVTGLVSNSKTQVVVYVANKLGADASIVGLENAGRSATTRGAFVPSVNVDSGLDYDKARELIELAQWLVDNDTSEDDIISMFNNSKEDKNKIKAALKLMDDMYCFVGGSAEETADRIISRRDSNEFDVPLAELQQHSEIMTVDNARFFYNDTVSDDEYVSFGIDEDGQIDKISYHWKKDGSYTVESINRDDPKSNVFTENVYKYWVEMGGKTYYTDSLPVIKEEYSKDQIKQAFREAYEDELTDSDYEKIDAIIDETDMKPTEYVHHNVIDLQGKKLSDSNKLRYTDFGYITILAKEVSEAGDGVGDDNSIVFGGYINKEIQNPTLTGMTFSGKAIAALGGVHQNGVKKIETGDTATTLTVANNGTQTLTMPFNDYYTISVEKPQNGTESISWTGTTSINENGNNYALDGNQPVNNQHVIMKYYGDDKTPSEVVGGIRFQNNGVEFDGAFGVKN